MPRPKTKEELKLLSNANYEKLNELVSSFSSEEVDKEFAFEHRDRKVRDVIAHLHQWHKMMLGWYAIGMSGQKPDMPAKGYTWKTLPDLNKKIWEKYQDIELNTARDFLQASFLDIQKLIDKHTNEELFEKKKYKWTGTTSLGAYLISATSSHYDWAMKLLRKHKRSLS